MDKSKTAAIIFIKASPNNLKDLNSALLSGDILDKSIITDPQILACGGYYDIVIFGYFNSVQEIGSFVIDPLRTRLGEKIADTRTVICWDIKVPNV